MALNQWTQQLNPSEMEIAKHIHFFSFFKYQNQDIVASLQIEKNQWSGKLETSCNHLFHELALSGHMLTQDQIKAAWLNIADPETILNSLGIPTGRISSLKLVAPMIMETDLKKLFSSKNARTMMSFALLGQRPGDPPYLRILPAATLNLLNGLMKENVDLFFNQKENEELKKIFNVSLHRIKNAMDNAVRQKNNFSQFLNQIEQIHQEIQTILALVSPYDATAFESNVIDKLTSGDSPIIPRSLMSDTYTPRVYLRNSAMHGFSSILSGIERQKGDNKLNVAVLHGTYFEASDLAHSAQTYKITTLNGDAFNQTGTFSNIPDGKKFDVFMCEFHHNISTDSKKYFQEKILDQVLYLAHNGKFSDKFTIVIDNTIGSEKSEEVKEFLNNPEIVNLIQQGRLNVAFVKSAQKFDMLGIDNYNGGAITTVNNPQDFAVFNRNMQIPEEQLKGLSYQGLTHLEKYGRDDINRYRRAIVDNTRQLYSKLPTAAIFSENSSRYNSFQISKNDDPQSAFLDLKFRSKEVRDAINKSIREYFKQNGLSLTNRGSYGFQTTNVISIAGHSLLRITPGLDSGESIDKMAKYFVVIQGCFEKIQGENPQGSEDDLDQKFIQSLNGRTCV
ncbi:MAG: hypothetical protein HQK53_00535 [Oligoflexia bacterium]|nr:hypothetical protein [Oligoflexia bacterium]